jgi:G:T/U-mismatch repair DNA glycosylase
LPYTLPYTCQTGASTLAKVKKTFRIEEDAYDELVELSAGWGVAQGAAVERAIRLARQMPDTLPDTCQTDASTPGGGDSAAVAALIEQLAKKDEQIAKLMETVADSTKAVQGAQALHHETAQTLALESTEQKLSRWQRLRKAWRG